MPQHLHSFSVLFCIYVSTKCQILRTQTYRATRAYNISQRGLKPLGKIIIQIVHSIPQNCNSYRFQRSSNLLREEGWRTTLNAGVNCFRTFTEYINIQHPGSTFPRDSRVQLSFTLKNQPVYVFGL